MQIIVIGLSPVLRSERLPAGGTPVRRPAPPVLNH